MQSTDTKAWQPNCKLLIMFWIFQTVAEKTHLSWFLSDLHNIRAFSQPPACLEVSQPSEFLDTAT